jgi:histidine decarboxylase
VRAGRTPGRCVDYIASVDTTITGSRSGHTPLLLWYALARYGVDGLRARAEAARRLAAYTQARLTEIGWEAWRNPHAFTVVLKTPPPAVTSRWVLANGSDGWSHVICMPGVTAAQIDRFVGDVASATGLAAPLSSTSDVDPTTRRWGEEALDAITASDR